MMKWLLLALLVGLGIYLFSEFRKMSRAVMRSHTLPEQTGEFWAGDKSKPMFNFLILGDSIAAGAGVRQFEESVGGRLAGVLGKRFHVHLSNHAVKGSWVSDMALERVEGKWDLVLIITGSNEIVHNVDLRTFRKFLNQLLTKFKRHRTKVILVGPGKVTAAKILPIWLRLALAGKQKQVVQVMRKAAAQNSVVYVDPLEHKLLPSYFSADGLHPNALGHKVWFDIIWPSVERAVK